MERRTLNILYTLVGLLACQLVSLSAPAAEGVRKMTILRNAGDAERKTVALFSVEVAPDEQAIRKGLSGREFMPDDQGMLFSLGNKRYFFWMKGMRFPLDIVVFGSDARVVDIIPENQRCERCPEIWMPDVAAYVLEINAGLAKKLGIAKGDYFEMDKE